MNRRILTAAAVAVVAALVFTGCSSGGSNNPTKKETLTVAAYIGTAQEPGGLPQLIKKFEKENPNVTVQFKALSSADYDTYMNPRLAAGTAPDVFMTDKGHLQQWVPQGYLANLSDQAWVSRINSNLKAYAQVGGKTYQLLVQNTPLGLYVNLDLLKSVGINSAPTDWPTFLSDLQTLKAAGKNGLMLPGGSNAWDLLMTGLSMATTNVSPSWALNYNSGTSKWNPTWATVVNHLKDLFTDGYVNGQVMAGIDPFSQGVQAFTSGQWAFYEDGGWDLSHFATAGKFKFSFVPYPAGSAGSAPHSDTYVGAAWAVNSKAKYPATAKSFVNFLSQPANDEVFLKAEASFSTLKDVKSPTVSQAAALAAAFAAGRTRPDDADTINALTAQASIQKVIQVLFSTPTTSTSSILDQLDATIPRSPIKSK